MPTKRSKKLKDSSNRYLGLLGVRNENNKTSNFQSTTPQKKSKSKIQNPKSQNGHILNHSTEKYLKIFEKEEAFLSGHFLLTSGNHSPNYVQCAKVMINPQTLSFLVKPIVNYFKNKKIDLVISPAVGAILLGYEIARQLKARIIFAERESGKMTLRRNFVLGKNQNILIAEDVITTGGSVKEIIEIVQQNKANLIGITSLVDRSTKEVFNKKIDFFSLLKIPLQVFAPEICPQCLAGVPVVKPGSRSI